MLELRLSVKKAGQGFQARWSSNDGEESREFLLQPPLDSESRAELSWYLEEFRRFVAAGTRARAGIVEQRLEDWGKALFESSLGSQEAAAFARKVVGLQQARQPFVLTLCSAEPAILGQPWELIGANRAPLALSGARIRRQLAEEDRVVRDGVALPLRLLLIVSRPRNAGFLDPRCSASAIFASLSGVPVEIVLCEPPTRDRLEEMIAGAFEQGRPYHIVHFDGHGQFDGKQGIGYLCFESSDQKSAPITGLDLGDLLSRFGVRLVILEACRTSSVGDRTALSSVAPAILSKGMESVLAFSHSVHVKAAEIFTSSFYRGLAGGQSVGQTVAAAREALHEAPNRFLFAGPDSPSVPIQDWLILQLYQGSWDPVLIDPSRMEAPCAPPTAAESGSMLHFFPPSPPYGFQGRSREIFIIERAFNLFPAIVVSGMGGMGKTCLAQEIAKWGLQTGRFEEAVFLGLTVAPGVQSLVTGLGHAVGGLRFGSLSEARQEEQVVEIFRTRRILVVWDNFESTLPAFQKASGPLNTFGPAQRRRLVALFRKMTQGNPAGRLLVTCRSPETGLPEIGKFSLKGLARDASLQLVAAIGRERRLDFETPGYERVEIERLLDHLQDHPLSIALVAPQLESFLPSEICQDFAKLLGRFQEEPRGDGRFLLASLEFSTAQLGPEARRILPMLAAFRGGALEENLRNLAGIGLLEWLAIRQELLDTALLRIEVLPKSRLSFVHFHPTLAYAQQSGPSAGDPASEKRFLALYQRLADEARRGLDTELAAGQSELLELEEANLRTAIEIAFRLGDREIGARLAGILGEALERRALFSEAFILAERVVAQMPADEKIEPFACKAIRKYAQTLRQQGRIAEAIKATKGLVRRLEKARDDDQVHLRFELAQTLEALGMLSVRDGRPKGAVKVLEKALVLLEGTSSGFEAVVLTSMAHALRELGKLEKALAANERANLIERRLGNFRNIAVGLDVSGGILTMLLRPAEAEKKFLEALALAQKVADASLEASVSYNLAVQYFRRGDLKRSSSYAQTAFRAFQKSASGVNEVVACNLLSVIDLYREDLVSAEAWIRRGHQLAVEQGDRTQKGIFAQHLGSLFLRRAKRCANAAEAAAWLKSGIESVAESLAIWTKVDMKAHMAAAHELLASLHLQEENIEAAEFHALGSRALREQLGLPEVVNACQILVAIAERKGDASAAAAWKQKINEKARELVNAGALGHLGSKPADAGQVGTPGSSD